MRERRLAAVCALDSAARLRPGARPGGGVSGRVCTAGAHNTGDTGTMQARRRESTSRTALIGSGSSSSSRQMRRRPVAMPGALFALVACVLACGLRLAQAAELAADVERGDALGTHSADQRRRLKESAPQWVQDGGFIILIFAMVIMFWALAVVCEEFFVPALNVLCEAANIPDDVAGATLMAAGASSPEMFSSFIALFITKSSLGVGTVVGSEIFNHLCINAGSVIYAKGGTLVLEWRILMREVMFYFVSLWLLIWALKTHIVKALDHIFDSDPDDKLRVHWYQALVLVLAYIVYALVCSYFSAIVKKFCPFSSTEGAAFLDVSQSVDVGPSMDANDAPLLLNENPDTAEVVDLENGTTEGPLLHDSEAQLDLGGSGVAMGSGSMSMSNGAHSHNGSTRPGDDGDEADMNMRPTLLEQVANTALRNNEPLPETLNTVLTEGEIYECWMWKKSNFYSRIPASHRAWQLRWFTLDGDGLRYRRNPAKVNEHVRVINIFDAYRVSIKDEERNIFRLKTPKRNYDFQCASRDVLLAMVKRTRYYIDLYQSLTDEERVQRYKKLKEYTEQASDKHDEQDEDVEGLLDVPEGTFGKLWHYTVLPLKFMFYYTVPDVRLSGAQDKYMGAIVSCVTWLAVLSYVMVTCAELLGNTFGIDDSVMGLTVSAVGTSFPNVFSSILVARQGLGNMAVSNAFGSNVFNIFMGLGLPWLLYIATVEHGDSYHELKDGGIVFSVVVLLLVLILYMLLLFVYKFTLHKWMGYVFVVVYIAYIVVALTYTP